ncbi:hypothetical protein [Cupriavidus sp. IK-TO18]|uniref:hypothetical protein n=1 Tax=Cupriavidus sp. IK-TO18 TaxID=2782182 RepID=UPI00189BE900|nr:hypothetical protein [Cupriavidus sp. IK-TO18]MBF6991984.1 hypothetical protein [Cupriavidus sp. IK-TO18]
MGVSRYLDDLEASGPAVNAACLVGHSTVITGNCGISLAPLQSAGTPPAPLDLLGTGAWRYESFGDSYPG